jgi:hypothetical protein
MRRWLKEKGLRWKRCRRSLKDQRDEAEFLERLRVLKAFCVHVVQGVGCSNPLVNTNKIK